MDDFTLNGYVNSATAGPATGGQYVNNGGYRYGFNGKENDDDVKGQGNEQDYGERIYDPRLGRFLSQDPLTKNYPWYSPYQFAANDPTRFIDVEGKGVGEPPIPFGFRLAVLLEGNVFVTKSFMLESAKIHGIDMPNQNLTTIGRIFEDAALRSLGLEDKKARIYPYPERPDKYFIPDALTDYTVTADKTTYIFKNAFITEAKFSTGNELKLEPGYNPEQIKGFIDHLSEARGVVIDGIETNERASDYGAAALILVTPADLKISDDIINYAKEKNVAVLKRVPIAVTSWIMKEDVDQEKDAMKNNVIKFSPAFVISPSVNKKINSQLYKSQEEGEESGDNNLGDKVKVNWQKK